MKLLLVNDEVFTANRLYQDIHWQACGIDEALVAYDADGARDILKKTRIDIVLLDIEMPGDNGIDLLRWIRRQEYETECIFLTCHPNFEYAQEAIALGCQDYVLLPASNALIEESIQKVTDRILSKNADKRLQQYGRLWMDNLQSEAIENDRDKKRPKDSVDEAVHYIMEHLKSEHLSVTEVAEHCYLTPIYLNRIFKQIMGHSIGQFIIQEKMLMAKKLLDETNLSANAVALELGYPSYPHFSLTFKKFFGYPPSQRNKK